MKKYILKKHLILFLTLVKFICFSQTNNTVQSTCVNENFEYNTLGWELYWKDNDYNQNQFLSNNSNLQNGSNNIPFIYETQNDPSQGKRISISNQNDYISEVQDSFGSGETFFNDVKFLRIGGGLNIGNGSEQIAKKQLLTIYNTGITFYYTAVFNDSELINPENTPYFKYKVEIKYDDGEVYNGLSDQDSNGYITPLNPLEQNGNYHNDYVIGNKKVYRRSIAINTIKYPDIDLCRKPTISVYFMVSDSKELIDPVNGKIGAFAFINQKCTQMGSGSFIFPLPQNAEKSFCKDTNYNLQITSPFLENFINSDSNIKWEITRNGSLIQSLDGDYSNFNLSTSDVYEVTLTINNGDDCKFISTQEFKIVNCSDEEIDTSVHATCIDCTSFSLIKKQKYLISGWTKLMKSTDDDSYENLPELFSYNDAYIGISFLDSNNLLIGGQEIKFYPSGELIDGWQKIQGQIIIPDNALDIKIGLINENGNNISAFFDDIRVHPFNGNLKSFVYDQATQKLMAELDENNYATFYEYDKEGGLVRIKKETEKGVFTIQETRSSTRKKQ